MNAPDPLRVTLVSIHPTRSPQAIPLANAFLAASLNVSPQLSGKLAVTILDLYADQTPLECAAAIIATEPDMAGFSVYVWNRELGTSTAKLINRSIPDVVLFCGGPEATADQRQLLSEAPWNFLVHGDGETPLTRAVTCLLENAAIAGIPGTAVLENGDFRSWPAAEETDLETIPSPFLNNSIDPSKYSGMLWQISRGCSFNCDFCFDAAGSRKVRRFSLKRLEAELNWFVEKGVSQVIVLDSTFNSDRERAVRILRFIGQIAPRIHFHFEVRNEFLDREQAELFAAITCSLQIGLQSADANVLKNVGRSFNRSDFVSRVGLLNETGAVFGFDLIFGLPGDSFTGFCQSLDFALGLYPNHLDIFPLALLSGTRLAARSREFGLEHQEEPPYRLISTPDFPEEDMGRAGKLAAACDLFYSRGKAVSWFMSTLYPLGIRPSRFLEGFYDYAQQKGINAEESEDLSEEEILGLQCGYVQKLFTEKKLKKLLAVALDLIVYNYHYSAALMAVPPETQDRIGNPGELRLKLAGSTRLAAFRYEILELLEAGHADLKALASRLSPDGSWAVIYPKDGEVRTESIDRAYFRLLEQLDGTKFAGDIVAELAIKLEDSSSFLEFVLAEGIVVTSA